MLRISTKILSVAAVIGTAVQGLAFSLMGPFAQTDGNVWQVPRIGYNLPGDIGGPMNAIAGEEYRWNTKVIVYAYDAPFFDFFGTRGEQEMEKMVQIINDLPAASQLNVDDYPMRSEHINFRAAALGLMDLKSVALTATLEEIGLASPNRWVYCLRNRYQPGPARFPVFFNVIRRNFDPVTAAESPYINGRLWTYIDIFDLDNPAWSFTVNTTVDPLDFGRFDPVAAAFDGGGFSVGSYFSGLSRDDVGAIKFMYQAANRNFEAALPNSTGSAGGSSWGIPGGANALALIDPAIRYGIDKVTFVRADYDSLLGQFFTPVTNNYTELVITNGLVVSQSVQRVLTVPDILYTARDLDLAAEPGGIPATIFRRPATASWVNDDGLTRPATRAGPGVIQPPIEISFNNVGFVSLEQVTGPSGNAVIGLGNLPFFLYGAFDGSTNEPVVFSQGGNITIQELEQRVLGR